MRVECVPLWGVFLLAEFTGQEFDAYFFFFSLQKCMCIWFVVCFLKQHHFRRAPPNLHNIRLVYVRMLPSRDRARKYNQQLRSMSRN